MTSRPLLMIIGLAALGSLVSLFLPWVWFADIQTAPQQIAAWHRQPAIQSLLASYPDIPERIGINLPDTAAEEVSIEQIFRDPVARELAVLARQQPQLSGWAIWFAVPKAGILLRMGLLLTLFTAGTSLGCILIPGYRRRARTWWVCGASATLTILVLISQVPIVDTFGIQNDLRVALVCIMSDARGSIGIWVALTCLLVISMSSFVTAYLTPAATITIDSEEV